MGGGNGGQAKASIRAAQVSGYVLREQLLELQAGEWAELQAGEWAARRQCR